MTDPTSITKGVLRVCCATPGNLGQPERLSTDLVVRVCRECGRRHFEAEAQPGVIGVRGAGL